jgi:hypothetical protein
LLIDEESTYIDTSNDYLFIPPEGVAKTSDDEIDYADNSIENNNSIIVDFDESVDSSYNNTKVLFDYFYRFFLHFF